MRYVILRDDDTNALTPIDCLERLYRPFLDRGLPVNLAVIPDVATKATTPEGKPEGFLTASCHSKPRMLEAMATISPSPPRSGGEGRGEVALIKNSERILVDDPNRISVSDVCHPQTAPISSNTELIEYLRENPGYRIIQHGCHHDYFEFDRHSPAEINARLDRGSRLFAAAGFPEPQTFVAPHDKFSRTAYAEISKRFSVLSCGWFERGRLPMSWWPGYVAKKIRRTPHWRVGDTTLLSHPGCFLSWRRPYGTMVEDIIRDLQTRRLTVLVTHWWEYFRDGRPDEEFIHCLHEVAGYLAGQKDIRVVSFADVAENRIPLS